MSFTYTVTLGCDRQVSPACRRAVEHADAQPGTMAGRNQLMGDACRAGWMFGRNDWDDIGLAVCPECLALDVHAADSAAVSGDVGEADERVFRHLLQDVTLGSDTPQPHTSRCHHRRRSGQEAAPCCVWGTARA